MSFLGRVFVLRQAHVDTTYQAKQEVGTLFFTPPLIRPKHTPAAAAEGCFAVVLVGGASVAQASRVRTRSRG